MCWASTRRAIWHTLRNNAGCPRHLRPTGLCLIQTSQAQMLDHGEFDTIYHEHHSFFTPRSMAVLAQRSGLALRAVHRVAIHGNSWLLC